MNKNQQKTVALDVESAHRLAISERKRFINQIKQIKEIPRHNSKIVTIATQDFDMLVMLAENVETLGYTRSAYRDDVLRVKNGLIIECVNSIGVD